MNPQYLCRSWSIFQRLALFFLILFLAAACEINPSNENDSQKASMVSDKDGMVMLFVPEGEFMMGSNNKSAAADEKPEHTVFVDAFWIDQTEITNEMYESCVDSGQCAPLVTPRPDVVSQPDFPVQGVAWAEAVKYCQWVERRLPTEAEWEKAARGTDGRLYPWGNSMPSAELLNFDFVRGDVVVVGSFPDGASPYGALDMGGNVWEWVADWYSDSYYAVSPVKNPMGPEEGTLRVIRGGAWNTAEQAVRVTNRFTAPPYRNDYDGFRCAANS